MTWPYIWPDYPMKPKNNTSNGTAIMSIVLMKLEENDLYLKPEKCEFEKEEIKYLGVIVGKNHLRMSLKKLQGVADWPVPKTPTDI